MKKTKKEMKKEKEKDIKEDIKNLQNLNPAENIRKLGDHIGKQLEQNKHPIIGKAKLTLGQRASDWLTKWAGSWFFIFCFLLFFILWMLLNFYIWFEYNLQGEPFDPYPFILLNLVLSCLAAIQAPIILMSQNRQTQRDRIRAEYDYQVNRKAEKEIQSILRKLDNIRRDFADKK